MGFNFFRSKPSKQIKFDYNFHEVYNEVFSFFQTEYVEEVELAKESFVKLTGAFDEEHEYFESKLDDFRSWFIFFYGGVLFSNLKKIKVGTHVEGYYEYLASGIFSYFLIQKIKGDEIILKDLSSQEVCRVKNSIAAMSMVKGDCVQTALYYLDDGFYEFGLSMVVHPAESLKYIKKKVKEVKKGKGISKEQLFERLIGMRYQFFKYRQLEVKQIYSDKSLFFEKMSES